MALGAYKRLAPFLSPNEYKMDKLQRRLGSLALRNVVSMPLSSNQWAVAVGEVSVVGAAIATCTVGVQP